VVRRGGLPVDQHQERDGHPAPWRCQDQMQVTVWNLKTIRPSGAFSTAACRWTVRSRDRPTR
jgi:hypothetical protein